ncbi:MAG: hypothetical protein IT260_10870 [Saprospiraceae bacterium]|nr:hypothetical protein [Saprospiraceae bacterium]
MLNRKLLEVLQRLSEPERKRLRLFLVSPFFNGSYAAEDILRLYDLILRCGADEAHPELDKDAVFPLFFPNRPFPGKAKSPLDSLSSELFRLVRQFLNVIDQETEQTPARESLAMARFYRKHALDKRFWQTLQAARKAQEEMPYRDAQYYLDQFRIEGEELAFRGMHNAFEDDINLNAAEENLDFHYSIQKLEYACALEYQKQHAQIEHGSSNELTSTVLRLSVENGPLDIPINRMYHLVIHLMQNKDQGISLQDLEDQLSRNKTKVEPEKYKNLQAYFRFLWLQKYYKAGDDFSRKRLFAIYKEHLAEGYFYLEGLIPLTAFRNIAIFALKLGEFDWVKNFLDTHPPERIGGTHYPAEIHSLNLAEYYFYQKQYEEAQHSLVYRMFENPGFSILADLLLVKIYFETQSDLLEARMKALDQKVRRSKRSRAFKNRYYNFLKKLDKIIKYGTLHRHPKRQKLFEEIKSTPEIASREWLLEKLK